MTEKRGVFEELCVEIECVSERKLVDGPFSTRSIADGDEEQPLWRRSRPGLGATLGLEDLGHPLRGALAVTDPHERSGDRADHIVQEAVGLDFDRDGRSDALDCAGRGLFGRCWFGWANRSRSCGNHAGPGAPRPPLPSQPRRAAGGRASYIEAEMGSRSGRCRSRSGIAWTWHRAWRERPGGVPRASSTRTSRRQHRVQGSNDRLGRMPGHSEEMDGSAPSACTPASVRLQACRRSRCAGQLGQRVLEHLLNRSQAGLALPAVEVGAVVRKSELDVPHRAVFRISRSDMGGNELEELFGDLDGVGGRSLAEVVAHAPEEQGVGPAQVLADAADEDVVLARGRGGQRIAASRRDHRRRSRPANATRFHGPARAKSAVRSRPGSTRCARSAPARGRRSG